jgi:signal transduction histidine kinase
VFDTTPQLGRSPILDSAALTRASTGTIIVEQSGIHGLDGSARLLATPVQAQDRQLVVVVGSSLEQRDHSLHNLTTLLIIGGPAALLLASLAGYLAAGTALKPVEAIRRRAAEISTSESDQRLPVPPANDELTRLGETLNQMLGRLQTALERERTFVDDASHELRTPLAAHKTELELALRYGETKDEFRTAIASAVEEADHLNQLAEDLLVLARAEKGQLSVDVRPTEIAPLFETIRERFESRIEESGRRLTVGYADGMRMQSDGVRVQQALTNLVENALRHGGGEIRLWARSDHGRIELHVSDSGPGFPSEFLSRAFERFSRGDEARTTPGTGLGLAIADEIARAHGGRALAANRPEGGADVWIELPLEPR